MKEAPLNRKPELGAERRPVGRTAPPFDAPHHSYWKTFWKAFAVFLLVSGVGVFAWAKFTRVGQQYANIVRTYAPGAIQAKIDTDRIFKLTDSDVVNILLIGRDVNWKIGRVYDPKTKTFRSFQVYDENAPARSDTMIIMSLDRARHEIHMVSLPRDARVHMPPNKYGVHRAKLNAAHAYGGPQLLLQTIHDDFGLTIHRYAVIRFEGFKKLIDQVGGIQVDVIGALKRNGKRGNLDYDDNWGNLHIHLKPGKQTLNGQQAHNYVRFRMDIEGDPGRIKRQQQVMRALAHKLAHQGIGQIPSLIAEIRKQFKTSMSNDELTAAAAFAQSLGDASKVQPLTMFGIYGDRGSLILNKPKNAQLFKYLFGPTFDESRFLENSPSTERDEMGEENNSSPGARAILIRAGLIKAKGATVHAELETAPEATSTSVDTTSYNTSPDNSRLAVADESTSPSVSEDAAREERPRRRVRRRESEESTEESTSSGSEPPRRRHRDRRELSVSDDEMRSSEDESTARSQSPVPVPEESTSSDSPMPRAE